MKEGVHLLQRDEDLLCQILHLYNSCFWHLLSMLLLLHTMQCCVYAHH